jgi:hypothetical protein
MTTTNKLMTPLTFACALALAAGLGGLAGGCATGSAAAAAPSGPVELDGTRWKLVMLGGKLDGRVVEFKKRGEDGYSGKLVELGPRLRDVVGLEPGYELLQLKRKGENEYEGVYKSIDPSGAKQSKEVVMFVSPTNLSWNQESAVWEKQ